MKWLTILLIILLIFIIWTIASGCAYVHVIESEWTSITCMKDIAIDPNGVVSTTTPDAEGIIGAVVGVLIGWLI